MKKLMAMMACVALALLLSSCRQQTAKEIEGQAKGTLDEAGKAAKKALEEAKAKIGDAAKQAADALGEQFTKAKEQTSMALKDVKGGSELLDKISAVFPSMQKALAGISDKQSAQDALPKLEELEGTVSTLSGQFEKLPEAAKKSVSALIQKGTSAIQPLVDTILAQPAVQSIRPKLEALMNQLKSLHG